VEDTRPSGYLDLTTIEGMVVDKIGSTEGNQMALSAKDSIPNENHANQITPKVGAIVEIGSLEGNQN
jgi:hypothetical protein